MQIPLRGEVYVISDAKYKELQQKQAQDEITVLERRMQSYERTADDLRQTIAGLRKEHGLLEPTAE
jgi:antitoxin component HigA of HigAB toxin-antitoxin module